MEKLCLTPLTSSLNITFNIVPDHVVELHLQVTDVDGREQ